MPFAAVEFKKVSDKAQRTSAGTTYSVAFQMKFTGLYTAAAAIAAGVTAGLPDYGAEHADAAGAYVSSLEVDIVDNSVFTGTSQSPGLVSWSVTYTTNGEFAVRAVSPLERPPVIAWRGTDRKEVRDKDYAGVAFVNPAGDQYDPMPEMPVEGAAECTITFNTATNPATWCTTLSNTANNATLWGVPAGRIWLGVIEASQLTEEFEGALLTYWQVTVPLSFNKNGWRLKVVACGFRELIEGVPWHITDESGARVASPVLLKADGSRREPGDGDPVIYPADGFVLLREVSWSGLSLPNPFA